MAGVHAGWRGAAAHIAEKTLRRMMAEFGTVPEDVWVYVGPCASACCYEVDGTVASAFDQRFAAPRKYRIDQSGHSGQSDAQEIRYMLDLKAATTAELHGAGVPATQIDTSPCCTICMPELFHSHRRDGSRSGRMMAVIGMLHIET